MWHYAGEPLSLTVDFLVDGEFVIPSTASYSLRDHSGLAIGDSTTVNPTGTSMIIEIPALSNEIQVSSLFENRFLIVKFVHEGNSHTKTYPYKLTQFVPIAATVDDVRRLTGLNSRELPDQDIDLTSAYFSLFDAYAADFSTQLVATDFRCRQANEAIALQAAIDVVSSFPLRVPVSVANEDAEFRRTASIDFAALERELRRKLQQALTSVLSVEETTIGVFSVSTPTDPYTGE